MEKFIKFTLIAGILTIMTLSLSACKVAEQRIDVGHNFYTTHFGKGDYNNDNNINGIRYEADLGEKQGVVVGVHASEGDNSFHDSFSSFGGDVTYMVGVTEIIEMGAGVRMGACEGYRQVNGGDFFPCGAFRGAIRHSNPQKIYQRISFEINYVPPVIDRIDPSLACFANATILRW